MVYKDLALLDHGRITNLEPEEKPSEMIVIDVVEMDRCDTDYVNYFQGQKFKGEIQYNNLSIIQNILKNQRQGTLCQSTPTEEQKVPEK